MSELRLCTGCKHHQDVRDNPHPGHMCTKRIPDMVSGSPFEIWLGPLCRDARVAGACGVDARYWEAADVAR